MPRTFKVGTTTEHGEVSGYFVTDANDKSELDSRPEAVRFPVTVLYDKELQNRRAQDYCDYLNKLAEAAQEAYEQNKLVNILKS